MQKIAHWRPIGTRIPIVATETKIDVETKTMFTLQRRATPVFVIIIEEWVYGSAYSLVLG